MEEIGFQSNDDVVVPYAALSAETKTRLARIACGGSEKGAIRKALYSELAALGCGTEGLGLIFEHGANALLPGGPLSFVPLSIEFEAMASLMEAAHAGSGVDNLLRSISEGLRGSEVPTVSVIDNGAGDAPESDLLPGVYHVALPSATEYAVIRSAVAALNREVQPDRCPVDQLRSLLALALCSRGIPLSNLRVFAPYYSLDSFFTHGGMLYFAALIHQSDAGLGIVPVALGEMGGFIPAWLRQLAKEPNRRIFHGRTLSDRENGMLIRRLQQGVGAGATECGKAIARFANLQALFLHGGMMTAAMSGAIIIKPNFYDVGDIVNAHNRVYSAPLGLDGDYWISPYRPTAEEIADRLDKDQLVRLARDKVIPGRNNNGRPRHLGSQFADPIASWSNRDLAAFFRHYRFSSSRTFIKDFLVEMVSPDESRAKWRATEILRIMRREGWMTAGRPLRLLPLELVGEFVTGTLHQKIVAWHGEDQEAAAKSYGQCLCGAALGMRLGEALRARGEHLRRAGAYEEIRILGTKNRRARRSMPLDLARMGPCGELLVEAFVTHWEDQAEGNGEGALFAHAGASAKRASERLSPVIHRAFLEFRGIPRETLTGIPEIDGRLSHHGLRHLAIIRLVQATVTDHLHTGNFWSVLSSIGFDFGQALPTMVCGYLGTACLTLKYPRSPWLV